MTHHYAYYPGCSLLESAVEYDHSVRQVMDVLDAELTEIPDWTCCGASAVESVSRLLTYVLPARNLALVEQLMDVDDILVPCSACYLNLLRVVEDTRHDKKLLAEINEALSVEDLRYTGRAKPRHLLDILINDVGTGAIAARTERDMSGFSAAAYYGCQILRPYPVFDDPRQPRSMHLVLEALGIKPMAWDDEARCCGASLMVTKPEAALASVARILDGASQADAVVTVCPMCQINLEAYQSKAAGYGGPRETVSVVYLPQLMGLAFGCTEDELMLNKNMSLAPRFRAGMRQGWATQGSLEETVVEEA
ncbi:CoB--CoM heterodisulfide reductase iron-sulfur subunit B family protein [Oceanidesulfovibrio marinus]|uniref:Disulfide reductase n=1 Tax=Oceanidesulfovibrio marinus TaxID=370038 RepID=A0A6P1ZH14_9BACT|nr:CoB--CoM heterodisulfide reductase iron-sulfur subunit B family protein [Oceanidesulfovibrio marinus]TVM33425.1 disulfide reductase [Oceanidesulfovibrio marinus]